MAKKILSIVLALTLALSVFTVAASAAEIEATAESFENDYKTAANGDVIVLTEDVEIYGNKQTSKDITVDLAGHTITCTATGVAGLIASSKTGNLTITDSVGGGKIDSDFAALQAQTGATVVIDGGTIAGVRAVANFSSAGTVVVNDGVVNAGADNAIYLSSSYSSRKPSCTVNGGEINGDVYTEANCVLTVNGGEFTSDAYCIVGNGTKKNTEITINDGTFTATSETGAAIYHPQGGTLTINGGYFEGADALYIKSGVTTINGGTFIGNGEAKEYSYYGNGFNSTGDAIVVDSCGYPNGQPPMVKIYDGEFESDEANAIGVYTYGESTPATVFVYGGTFSDDSAEGFGAPLAYNATTGAYYDTLDNAGAAAADGDTIVLMNDIDADYVEFTADVTVDLAGKAYTATGDWGLCAVGADVTIIDSVGGGSVNATYAVDAENGGTLTVKSGVINGMALSFENSELVLDGGTINAGSSYATQVGGEFTFKSGTINGTVLVYGGSATMDGGLVNGNVWSYGAGSSFELNDGEVIAPRYDANGDAIDLANVQSIKVYAGASAVINGGTSVGAVIVIGEGSSLEVNGGYLTGEWYPISGVGNAKDCGTTIVINGGEIVAPKTGTAIYHPQSGTLTINGGKIVGGDAIYQKSGYVEINGGELYGIGAEADFEHSGNGYHQTGETIVIESCAYPGGAPSLRINGGKFYSRNSEIISYYYTEGNELDSTAFVYGGQFEKTVPAEFWANANAFALLNINGGVAAIEEGTNNVTITANAEKVEVYLNTSEVGARATFSDLTGGATLSAGNQVFARTAGTFVATVNDTEYNVTIVFPHFDVEDLLQVTNATIAVEGDTVTLTAIDNDSQIQINRATTAGTGITFGATDGSCKVSKSGSTLYAVADGTAEITVPNSGEYTVVFDFEEPEFVFSTDLLKVQNGTAALENGVITITPVDATKSAALVYKLTDGTEITFSNLSADAKISGGKSLYANTAASATATINGEAYTVVFDYEVIVTPLDELLKVTNATVEVTGSTIVLTPVDESKQVNFYPTLKDGSAIDFINITGLAKTTSAGTLYAKGVASATAVINNVSYDVEFAFTPVAPTPVIDLLKTTGATVEVEGTTITLTATGAQVNFYPTLKDGSAVIFSGISGLAKTTKSGTLYAKGAASAVATIGGVDYTVNFVF